MKHLQHLLIAAALLSPAVEAAPSISWDKLPENTFIGVRATVVTKAGKKYESQGEVIFTPTEVTLVNGGVSVPRQDVKEIVIRQKWDKCCEALWFGAELVVFGGQMLGGSDDEFLEGFAAIVVGLPMAAVTSPPALVIQAFHRWTTHTSYKVIP